MGWQAPLSRHTTQITSSQYKTMEAISNVYHIEYLPDRKLSGWKAGCQDSRSAKPEIEDISDIVYKIERRVNRFNYLKSEMR